MTQAAAVALAKIQNNVSRIIARFNDPASSIPGEAKLRDEINDTVVQLINVRDEADMIDLGGEQY